MARKPNHEANEAAVAVAIECPPALARLAPLTEAEKKLLSACRSNAGLALGDKAPKKRTEKNTVRADIIKFLVSGVDKNCSASHGFYLAGAFIVGDLNLSAIKMAFSLKLRFCRILDQMTLEDASLITLSLSGSNINGMHADRIGCAGGIFLDKGFIADGEVRLLGADVNGPLSCIAGKFQNRGDALSLDQARFGSGIFLRDGFESLGKVRLVGVTVNGAVDCSNAKFQNAGGDAISLDSAVITGSVDFRNSKVTGELRAIGCKIGGRFNAARSHFENAGGNAVSFDAADLTGNLIFKNSTISGCARFPYTQVTGTFDLNGSNFNNPDNIAIYADGIRVRGSTSFSDNFNSKGLITLKHAKFGTFTCEHAVFEFDSDTALALDGTEVHGMVKFQPGFRVNGMVSLVGTHVKGDLDLTGAILKRSEGLALAGDGLRVDGRLLLCRLAASGAVSFTGARVTNLVDDSESWRGGFVIDGFRYERIGGGSTGGLERSQWLRDQKDQDLQAAFLPQPWEHLAKVLREMGHFEEAKFVLIEKQRAMRNTGVIGSRIPRQSATKLGSYANWAMVGLVNFAARRSHDAYGAFAGFGYRPLKTFGWMIIVWAVCAAVYWAAAVDGMFGPANPRLYMDPLLADCGNGSDPQFSVWARCTKVPGEYTKFNAAIYSLDLVLPVVDFAQDRDWAPMSKARSGKPLRGGSWLRVLVWFETIVGWLISLLLVSALGRLIQKD